MTPGKQHSFSPLNRRSVKDSSWVLNRCQLFSDKKTATPQGMDLDKNAFPARASAVVSSLLDIRKRRNSKPKRMRSRLGLGLIWSNSWNYHNHHRWLRPRTAASGWVVLLSGFSAPVLSSCVLRMLKSWTGKMRSESTRKRIGKSTGLLAVRFWW